MWLFKIVVVIDSKLERLYKRHLKWRDLFVQVVCVLGFLINLFFGARLSLFHLRNLRTTHLFCTLYWLIFFIVIDTCFVLWIFLLWLTYIFLIIIDHCEGKQALWYIVKCDSRDWLFTYYFCLIIWYSTGSCLNCCHFCNDIRILFYPQLL